MQYSYNHKYARRLRSKLPNHQILLPSIISPDKIQKQLTFQIQAIDQTLKHNVTHSSQYQYFNGFLFTIHVKTNHLDFNDKLVTSIESSINKNNAIIQDGFTIWTTLPNPQKNNLVTKYQSINQRLIHKSLKNIQDYQIKKSRLLKRPRNWVKYYQTSNKSNTQSTKIHQHNIHSRVYTEQSMDKSSLYQSITKNTNNRKNQIKTENLQTTLTTSLKPNLITKAEIRMMVSKFQKIIGVWVPPVTYPQFHGMFTYSLIRKKHQNQPKTDNKKIDKEIITNHLKCRISRYFFYRHSLSQRLFEAIIQHVSKCQNQYIQIIQLKCQKQVFHKIFEQYGWYLKCWDSDKIRIQYRRQFN